MFVYNLIKNKKIIPLENYLTCNKYKPQYNDKLFDYIKDKTPHSSFNQYNNISNVIIKELNNLKI